LGPLPVWYWIAAQIVFFTLLDDFLYYWMHRLLHVRWLLRHVHAVHHRIKNTCAMDGNYFHWLEFVLTGTLSLVGPLLIGAHVYVVWIWIVIRQFEAADGHCGYDFPLNPMRLFPLYKGPAYHDFHHARFKGNYAGFLPYLDSLMGTYIKDYLTYVAQRKARRLP
jgi:methylsterol monooxygenase/4-alpha-methyl-delta7-sterol-4alpha-methyl oxidase